MLDGKEYEEMLKERTEERIAVDDLIEKGGVCLVCGHDDPQDLERHHVALRVNSPINLPMCRNCHGKATRDQRYWPKVKERTPENREGYMLLGISKLLMMVARWLREMGLRRLREK